MSLDSTPVFKSIHGGHLENEKMSPVFLQSAFKSHKMKHNKAQTLR